MAGLGWFMERVVAPLARRVGERRMALGRPRSVWGAVPILTLPLKAQADRMLGLRSETVVFRTYHIARNFDFNFRIPVGIAWRLGHWPYEWTSRLILAWAALRYDVFHYFFDRGLMPPGPEGGIRSDELDFLSLAGKRVYAFAYGADVRTREATLALGRWNFCVDCTAPGRYCRCDDARGAAAMSAMMARLTAGVALGDMLAYVPGVRALHYWPVDMAQFPDPGPALPTSGPLRIAHAPNHTHFKGSSYLEAAIERLLAEGHAIEYVKIQGVPNHEVRALFRSADLVADQFIGGAYGFTALEGMAAGKPVLTYVRSAALVEATDECPLIQATPDTAEDVLRWALVHRDELVAIGRQGRRYVERWHCIEAVAARLGVLYGETGRFPAELAAHWQAFGREEATRRAAIPSFDGWQHPFTVSEPGHAVGTVKEGLV